MLPTTDQVNYFLKTQDTPVSSKIIAKHFGCTAPDINRSRDGYIGIYQNPDVSSRHYLHRIKTELLAIMPQPDNCIVCLEALPQFPVSMGCCSAKMCSPCTSKCMERNFKCPQCGLIPDWVVKMDVYVEDVEDVDLLTERIARLQAQVDVLQGRAGRQEDLTYDSE